MSERRKAPAEMTMILERANRLAHVFRPTPEVADALQSLQGADNDKTLTKQARARLAALAILQESFDYFVTTAGYLAPGPEERQAVEAALGRLLHRLEALPPGAPEWVLEVAKPGEAIPVPAEHVERFKVVEYTQKGLDALREWMEANLKKAEALGIDADCQGIKLDPTQPGRSTVRKGGRGSPPTLLHEVVEEILHEWYPDWPHGEPFPEKNTKELQVRLHRRLIELVETRPSFLQLRAPLFHIVKDISPGRPGPLYSIIKNLQRKRR